MYNEVVRGETSSQPHSNPLTQEGFNLMPAKTARKATTVKFGAVELAKHNPSREDAVYVPTPEDYMDPRGLKEKVATAFSFGHDILIMGDTGTGKTALARSIACDLNMPYRRFPCHEATDTSALIGRFALRGDHTVWVKGIAYEAAERGHLLCLDEYNMAHADVRVSLNSLHATDEGVLIVSENEGEVVPRHPDFRMIATGNPDEYGGTKEWGAQIMRRFGLVLWVDYLPSADEQMLLVDQTGVSPSRAKQHVDAANAVRQAKDDDRLRFPMSYDDIRNWAIYSEPFGVGEAAQMCVLNKITDKLERNGVSELLAAHFTDAEWTR